MNVIMLFTIYCRDCNYANTWNINKAPITVKLASNVGYSVCCESCHEVSEYRLHEIKMNQDEVAAI